MEQQLRWPQLVQLPTIMRTEEKQGRSANSMGEEMQHRSVSSSSATHSEGWLNMPRPGGLAKPPLPSKIATPVLMTLWTKRFSSAHCSLAGSNLPRYSIETYLHREAMSKHES